jgi:hypothetical protein
MDWISALALALAGAILTLFVQAVWKWITGPNLNVICSDHEAGCFALTPAFYHNATGQTIATSQQNYLRIKVKNSGYAYAKGVSVCVTEIGFRPKNGTWEPFDEEVLDLKAAITGMIRFDLPARGHRFVDLAHCSKVANNSAPTFGFDFLQHPQRYANLNRVGTYRVKTFVSAENSGSRIKTIQWEWDGTLSGLVVVD